MPAPFTDYSTHLSQNPWEAIASKERSPWYVPSLYEVYERESIYNSFVSTAFNHNGPRAEEMRITSLIQPHANFDPIGFRQDFLDTSHVDSFERRIRFQRYAGLISLNRYDDRITYWQQNNVAGLERIIQSSLGSHMTRVLDKVARNAFLQAPIAYYGDGSVSDFSGITTSMTAKVAILKAIRLGLKGRDTKGFVDPTKNGYLPAVVCVTTPGVVYDLQNELDSGNKHDTFIEVNRYANPNVIMNGEIGTFYGIRFVETNDALLRNVGTIIAQTAVTAPIAVHDGAPNPSTTAVDRVEYVGQAAAKHYIEVGDTTGISVNDVVTIHTIRTNDFGVTNGVDYRDGKAHDRRVVSKTSTTLTFDTPILEPFDTDLTGTGVYGWVTKGRNIHSMAFIADVDGVVMGVSEPPTLEYTPPMGHLKMYHHWAWQTYMGWQPFNKKAFEMAFVAGSTREYGALGVQ